MKFFGLIFFMSIVFLGKTLSCSKPALKEDLGRSEDDVHYDGPLKISPDGTIEYANGSLHFEIGGGQMQDATKSTFSSAFEQVEHQFSEGKLSIGQYWEHGIRLETIAEVRNDQLVIAQYAENHQGVSSVSFKLTVSDEYDVLIPAWGGIRLSKQMPTIHLGFQRLSYPNLWQAQMLLIQGEVGGLLIHADDNGTQFKALTVQHLGGNFEITIETVPQAPFDTQTAFKSVSWHAIDYKGTWEQGALIYKDYANEAFDLSTIDIAKPSWARDIGFVVLTDIEDQSLLYELARVVDPTKTLLHVPGWRSLPYDVGYPDYTPDDDIRERIKLAKRLGFRVGVHFNMIGADDQSPEYKMFLTNSHTLEEFSKQPIYERYEAFGRQFNLAQINPASAVWRAVITQKVIDVVKDLDVDVIHLDQSLLCFNDGRGLIESMTSMQGNVMLQKDLADALPGIAYSGEGINEMNVRYASFLQMHAYGVNSTDRTWEASRFQQIVPLAALIFGDAMSIYHYPAMPNPITDPDYFAAWHNAGFRMGQIPTIMRVNGRQLEVPNAITKQVLAEAKWTQENLPKIYNGVWKTNVPLILELKNGEVVFFRDINGELSRW